MLPISQYTFCAELMRDGMEINLITKNLGAPYVCNRFTVLILLTLLSFLMSALVSAQSIRTEVRIMTVQQLIME